MTVARSVGLFRARMAPSGATTRSTSRGCISFPRFATAAATIAIWSGVTWSRSWPIATRPMSTESEAPSSLEPLNTPLGVISSDG